MRPAAEAAKRYVPTLLPSVTIVAANPSSPVATVVSLNRCPVAPDGMELNANVTGTPATLFPPISTTRTASGFANDEMIFADWFPPNVDANTAAAPADACALNETIGTPFDNAETVYRPALLPSVNRVDATPDVSVVTETTESEWPDASAVGSESMRKVMVESGTPFPDASTSLTTKSADNGCRITADCPFPLSCAMEEAAPAVANPVNPSVLPLPSVVERAATAYVPRSVPNVRIVEA